MTHYIGSAWHVSTVKHRAEWTISATMHSVPNLISRDWVRPNWHDSRSRTEAFSSYNTGRTCVIVIILQRCVIVVLHSRSCPIDNAYQGFHLYLPQTFIGVSNETTLIALQTEPRPHGFMNGKRLSWGKYRQNALSVGCNMFSLILNLWFCKSKHRNCVSVWTNLCRSVEPPEIHMEKVYLSR